MAVFPQAFIDSLHEALGSFAPRVLEALAGEDAVTAVRTNTAKIDVDSLRSRFAAPGRMVPWRGDAFLLEERPVFALDALFHAGAYYVQDPSAMFVGSVADALIPPSEASLKVLDLCAAPGGKSTSLAAALRGGDLLVSNEVIGSRASVLAENMVKWGSPNTVVTNNDPKDFSRLAASFDIILADVPCSGEGMFRKDPAAIAEWSPEGVNLCAARQRRIVADVWPALREGGWLIYSTCTFNRSENDGNVEWICRELGGESVSPEELPGVQEGCVATKYGLQLAPGITQGEGQYVAVVRKISAEKVAAAPKLPRTPKAVACDWLLEGMLTYEVETSAGKMLKAYPQALESDIRARESQLRVLRSGVGVALVKGRDRVPMPDLALSQAFRREAFPSVELGQEQALNYLRCQPLSLPEAPKGFLVVTSERLPLGFVKNLGSRANNLYPQGWRLRL